MTTKKNQLATSFYFILLLLFTVNLLEAQNDCLAGTTSDGNGGCVPCDLGFANPTDGGTCEPCAEGESSDAGATTCFKCPVGTYNPLTGGLCIPCGPGTISNQTGQVDCTECPAGRESSVDRTECIPCAIGTFNPISAGVCVPCTEGFTTLIEGAIECVPINIIPTMQMWSLIILCLSSLVMGLMFLRKRLFGSIKV